MRFLPGSALCSVPGVNCWTRPRQGYGRQADRKWVTALRVAGWVGVAVAALGAEGPPAQGTPNAAGDTNAVATYDGGKITGAELAVRLEEPRFVTDAEQSAAANTRTSQKEKVARHIAALRILVEAARQKGFDKAPGWALEVKLTEQGTLAQALTDDIRRQAFVGEKEVADEYETNRFEFLTIETFDARRIGISAKKHGAQALDRAKEALGLLRNGQEFAAVAKQYSDLEPNAAERRNYPANTWGKTAGLGLAALGEGKVSAPLTVDDGFELVKVEGIHVGGNPGAEEAKAQILRVMFEKRVAERIDQMMKAAEQAIAFVPGNLDSWPGDKGPHSGGQAGTPGAQAGTPAPLREGGTNAVALRCGQFAVTREELRGFAEARGVPDLEPQKLIQIIQQEYGYQIQFGEVARSMGLLLRPEVQRACLYELEKQLALKARQRLEREFAATTSFPEERLRDDYEKKFTATFQPLLQYDVLVVPLRVAANASTEERQAAVSNTTARAQELIKRAQEGASFNTLAAGDSSLQVMTGQSRAVPEGSGLYPLVAGLKAGAVAAEPYEDFGGFCVLRVNKYEARRKMPFDLAKAYLLEGLRNEALAEIRRDFQTFLLNKYHFVFGPAAERAGAEPATGTKSSAPKQ